LMEGSLIILFSILKSFSLDSKPGMTGMVKQRATPMHTWGFLDGKFSS
jgi:hypothetical protein